MPGWDLFECQYLIFIFGSWQPGKETGREEEHEVF